jgi:hypothetical protein
MSDALQSGFAVFLTAGAFVGIAFQPAFWYFVAMGVSLSEYVRRVEEPQAPLSWRAARAALSDPVAASAATTRSLRSRPAWGDPAAR